MERCGRYSWALLKLCACFSKISLLFLYHAFVGVFRALQTPAGPVHIAIRTTDFTSIVFRQYADRARAGRCALFSRAFYL